MHPAGYEPMLATASRQLDGDGWAFEPKLDGWRAIVHVGEERVSVYSRPGRNVTADLPQLGALDGAVPAGTVLDGELVSGSGGSSSFYQLSPHLSARRAAVTFAAFDLLALPRRSLINAPYWERRQLLSDLSLIAPAWCTVPVWTDIDVADLLAACELHGVEGPMAKRIHSRYRPGRRSPDWVKVKTHTWRTTHAPLRIARR